MGATLRIPLFSRLEIFAAVKVKREISFDGSVDTRHLHLNLTKFEDNPLKSFGNIVHVRTAVKAKRCIEK